MFLGPPALDSLKSRSDAWKFGSWAVLTLGPRWCEGSSVDVASIRSPALFPLRSLLKSRETWDLGCNASTCSKVDLLRADICELEDDCLSRLDAAGGWWGILTFP
jgi:hypothetical protein